MTSKARKSIFVLMWMLTFVVALMLDSPVASYIHSSGIAHIVKGSWWAEAIKWPGDFPFTIAVAAALLALRQIRWKHAVFLLLAGVISGLNALIKWIIGRTRPFKLAGPNQPRPFELQPFRHGWRGLFQGGDLCFPSGHACTAFTLLAAIMVVWPRGAWIFFVLAIAVSVERVAENAHYVSDVVGAAGFSVVAVMWLRAALLGWMTANTYPRIPPGRLNEAKLQSDS